MKQLLLAFMPVFILLLTSCGAQHQLQQADKAYVQALEMSEQIQPQLYGLNQQKNGLNIQGRALQPEEIEFIQAVERIEDSYANWKDKEIKASGAGPVTGARKLLTHQKAWLVEILSIQEKVNALAGRTPQ